jgi:N-acetylmuramoyl-L-alanine amidase
MDDFRADVAKLVKAPTLYRVQVGAFSVQANADKLCKELKAKGYQAFVVKE